MRLKDFLIRFAPITAIAGLLIFIAIQYNRGKKIQSIGAQIVSAEEHKTDKASYKFIDSRDRKWTTPEEVSELCDGLGVIYTKGLLFSNDCAFLAKVDKDYIHFDCPVNRLEGERAKYLKDSVANYYRAPIYIQWIDDVVGYGVFAEKPIKADEFIVEYTGMVHNSVDDSRYAWKYPCVPGGFGVTKRTFMIDGRLCGNEARFVNDPLDSKAENVKLGLVYINDSYHVVYLAARDIAPGEQLLVSYGEEYWKDRLGENLNPSLYGRVTFFFRKKWNTAVAHFTKK